MSLDPGDYGPGDIGLEEEMEIADQILSLSPEEVLDMSESEYRTRLLRHKEPLTMPRIIAVENSIGRERQKLEDWYDTESGPEKWRKIGDQILPRWADILGELHRRKQYTQNAAQKPEKLYRQTLEEEFGELDKTFSWLETDSPDDSDIVEFVKAYREIENLYEDKVHRQLD